MFRFSLATNDVLASTRTCKSVFLRTLGRSNSVCLYWCAKEGKFMLCVPKMQIALVPIKRKIKFNVVDTFIRVWLFFLFFVLAFFTIAIVKQLYLIHLHPMLHPVTFCYIRSAVVLLGLPAYAFSLFNILRLSTIPIQCVAQFPAGTCFRPKKGKLDYFRWDFNSLSTETIRQKNKHLRYQLMVLVGFLVENRANKKGFVQVSKILPANFWPFHCTVKLPYVKK